MRCILTSVHLDMVETHSLFSLQYKPTSCEIKAHKGDKIKVHYRVSLLFRLLLLFGEVQYNY